MLLTEKNVKIASVNSILKDEKITGLYLKVNVNSKVFYLYYRTKNGIQRRPKIGTYGAITISQARDIARTMLAEITLGNDPSADRSASKDEKTIADLWAEFKTHKADKKRVGKEYEAQYRLYISPRFAKMKLANINFSVLTKMMQEMADTPIAANRTLTLIGTMFNFAIDPLEWVEKNPTGKVERYPETKRKRYMAGDEAAKIAEILHRDREKYPASVAFIYLLILTGARCGEIKNAKWSMIQGNKIVLTKHKTDRTGDNRIVRLPVPAMELLDTLPKIANGTITGILSPVTYWESVRKEAGCPDLRLHDLRHSFASAALSAGLSLAQIGELLGHKSAQTTMRYAHLVDECAEAAATAAADQIMSRMKVIPDFAL